MSGFLYCNPVAKAYSDCEPKIPAIFCPLLPPILKALLIEYLFTGDEKPGFTLDDTIPLLEEREIFIYLPNFLNCYISFSVPPEKR